MSVYEVTSGASPSALKAVVYGPEGVGKTTFAASWPKAVFIDVEGGSTHYDVARLPRPATWTRLLDEIHAAAAMPEVGTVVIDTADAAEALCISHVCTENGWKGIEGAGYGKGYTYLAEEFSKLLAALDTCVAAGKHALVVAHAQIRKFEQPDELGAYDRWELKLQKKDAPLVKEWADLLLFANFKADIMRDEQTKKAKATGGKRRLMHASHSAAFDAKNRLGLPDEMPFEFAAIESVVTGQPTAQTQPTTQAQPEPTVHDELRELMAASRVTDNQLRTAVASRENNPYTSENHIDEYASEFVRDVLIAHWDAILDTIAEQAATPID